MLKYFAILSILSIGLAQSAWATDIVGPPTVIDGETLVVAGQRLKLDGIDAPDLRQTCTLRGRTYNCGRVSRTALMDLVAGTEVRCRLRAKGGSSSRRAVCRAGGYDLSAGMVHTGWAMAVPRTGTVYARIERKAQAARRGLWKGTFETPWQWRAANR